MTDQYEELLRHLRMLARGKHDDVSIAADAAGAIIALLAERDELRELTESGRWYSQETMNAVVSERDALAKDAARYRWLRRSNNATLALHLARSECPERMDAEIDAEMAGGEGEG